MTDRPERPDRREAYSPAEPTARGGLDTTKPNIARVYDALLGGKDNYAADRAVAQGIIDAVAPHGNAAEGPRLIRAALVRAVRYLAAEAGLSQFLDLGSGLPTQQNVHEVAQRSRPGAHVVYVDSDPVAVAHGHALLARDGFTAIVMADFRDPDEVLDHPDTRTLIDPAKPIGLIMSAILHHMPDEQNPGQMVAAYRDRMPPGSHLFLTHLCKSGDHGELEVERILRENFGSQFRTAEEIERFLDGWEVLPPGLVFLPQLLPDRPVPADPADLSQDGRANVGAIARLPRSGT